MLLLLLSVLSILHISCSSFLPSASTIGRSAWIQEQKISASENIQVTFALRQRNTNFIRELVEKVSNPKSPDYGHYLTLTEIAEIVAPEPESIKKVSDFVESIGGNSIHLTKSRDFLTFLISTGDLENTLNCRMYSFRHKSSGRIIYRTLDPVKLPDEIASEIEIVLGLTDFFDYNKERKKLSEQNKEKFAQKFANASSAPEIITPMRGSESEVIAQIKINCLNGNPATTIPACPPNFADSLAFEIVYNDGESISVNADIDTSNCNNSTGVVICQLQTKIRPYERFSAQATVQFIDGTYSAQGTYPTVFTPSPWGTPQLVYDMYSIPQSWRGTHPNNSQSVVAFEEQYISLDDLRLFFTYVGMPQDIPVIVGKNDPTNPGGESSLDIQWVMAMGAGVPTTFWSVSGSGPTHGGGAYVLTWALQIADTENPPLITSISYGDTEQGFFGKFGNYDYINRMNDELAKMALRGLTVIAGSGDAGASNVGEDGNDISDTDPTCTPMRPFFPSNSPYVLSVSGTFFAKNTIPFCAQNYENVPVTCSKLGEVAVSVKQGTHWTTGGGFSNLTKTPSWQQPHVQNFLKLSQGSLPPAEMWNSSGRAYPDVSAIGFNLPVIIGGQIFPIGGTSASGPIIAGILSLINDARLSAHKPPIGFVNPALYQSRPGSFKDIVVGDNFDGDLQPRNSPYPTYCPYGFKTQPGWDAVSGLGTPNFQLLLDELN